MTDQEINIAIAESVGYVRDSVAECWMLDGNAYYNDGSIHYQQLPNYVADLNAMNEVEKGLKAQEVEERYIGILGLIVEEKEAQHECWEKAATTLLMLYCVAHASSRRRAEAYLKTIGKWRE